MDGLRQAVVTYMYGDTILTQVIQSLITGRFNLKTFVKVKPSIKLPLYGKANS